MIKLLQFKGKEIFHKFYDMIEVGSYSFKKLKTQRQLRFRRIFEMIDILKNVYIVFDFMISDKHNFILYINNYVDWDFYNTLYNMNFMKKKQENQKQIFEETTMK